MAAQTTTETPATRREVWLSIALAVAKDGLPEPSALRLYEFDDGTGSIVTLNFARWIDATRWAQWLHVVDTERWQDHEAGVRGVYYHTASRDGWTWNVDAHEPLTPAPAASDLAAQVVAAILTPDSVPAVA